MYDVAREQSPRPDLLSEMLGRSAAAGYNALGLYLEHRFEYASAPWAGGPGCLTTDMVRTLRRGAPAGFRIIPFLNTLGHVEGFIRAEGGQWLREGHGQHLGLQMCPTNPRCGEFARGLIDDALAAFDDEWVHVGGDETEQLGQCPRCAARVAAVGKGGLYGEYFGPLCRFVLERGRRPCLWGDMLVQHPEALQAIPRETLIFDWQYFKRPRESSAMFRERGLDVVCCPSVQTYNSGWCFLDETQRVFDEHAADARGLGALGVLLTTWEFSFFTQYRTTLPIIYAAGRRLSRGEDWGAALIGEGGAGYAAAADIVGRQIPAAAEFLRPGTWRQMRDRLVIRQNPFYLWEDWRDEACGPAGGAVLRLCDEADAHLPADAPLRFAVELHRVAVRWVRACDDAHVLYANRHYARAAQKLIDSLSLLARLGPGLSAAAEEGGSAADVHRLERLMEKVRIVAGRIRALDDSPASGYRPSFETIVHDGYIAGDQAAWRTGWVR